MPNNILITGKPRSGKTTLVEKIIDHISRKKGFITREITDQGKRTGFLLITHDSNEKVLASTTIKSPYKVSRYHVDVDGFDKMLEGFETFSKEDFLYVDEIGKMELYSQKFRKIILKFLDSDNILLATIAKKSNDPFIVEIKKRADVIVYDIDITDREVAYQNVIDEIYSILKGEKGGE